MIEKEVKRRKTINIIINIILIILCLFNFFFNMNDYMMVLTRDYQKINSISDINKESKYFFIDMQPSTISNYNLKGDGITANMYSLKMDNENLLIILKENTLLTDKTEVKLLTDDIIIQLKDKFEKSEYKYILTNIDLNEEVKIDLYKAYILLILIFIGIVSIIINMFGFINPKGTHLYKKLMTKLV